MSKNISRKFPFWGGGVSRFAAGGTHTHTHAPLRWWPRSPGCSDRCRCDRLLAEGHEAYRERRRTSMYRCLHYRFKKTLKNGPKRQQPENQRTLGWQPGNSLGGEEGAPKWAVGEKRGVGVCAKSVGDSQFEIFLTEENQTAVSFTSQEGVGATAETVTQMICN